MKTLATSSTNPLHWRKIGLELIVLLCILLFVYTAISKLTTYTYTVAQLERAPLTADIAGFIGWAVPVCELLIAAMLCHRQWRLMGLYAFLGLMTLFTIYIVQTLFFSEILPCGCGGAVNFLSWSEHLLFNIGFMLLAVAGIVLQYGFQKKRKEVTGNE